MADIIKVSTREQIVEVARLAREVWTEHYTPIIGQAQVDYMLGRFQSVEAIEGQLASGCIYYTVGSSGGIEGYMALIPEIDGTTLLSKLYVRSAVRGRGLGKALLAQAEADCRAHQSRCLWLTVNKYNTDTLAWYEYMGFRNTGPVVQEIGEGFVMDDYRMEKPHASVDLR